MVTYVANDQEGKGEMGIRYRGIRVKWRPENGDWK
jgi:hypothetical protein